MTSVSTTAVATRRPTGILDLSNEILLSILAKVPIGASAPKDIRLVCRHFNNLTKTNSLYLEITRSQFPEIGALFCPQPTKSRTLHAAWLQDELDGFVSDITVSAHLNNFPMSPIQKSILERGLILLWWLSYHALEFSCASAAGFFLVDSVRRKRFSFAAILTVRMAIIFMLANINEYMRWSMAADAQLLPGSPIISLDNTTNYRLFLAFEAAILWSECRRMVRMRDSKSFQFMARDGARAIFPGLIDTSGTYFRSVSSNYRRINGQHLPSHEPWTVLPSLLKETAPSCQQLRDALGLNLSSLSNEEQYQQLQQASQYDALLERVLEALDLKEIGQHTVFRVPRMFLPLPYWALPYHLRGQFVDYVID